MALLPAIEGTCPCCAVNHEPASPHNAQSLFYQYWFYGHHGRWPTWADAIAHCEPGLQAGWRSRLKQLDAWTEPDGDDVIASDPNDFEPQPVEFEQTAETISVADHPSVSELFSDTAESEAIDG